MDYTKPLINLLIIDPQNDFHEGGNLAVPGATNDSKNIIQFLKRKIASINHVFVSLDTHTLTHIGHAGFWESEVDQSKPVPFTMFRIVNDKIEGYTLDANGNVSTKYNYKPTRYTGEDNTTYEERVKKVKKYIKKLIDDKKFTPLIWPTHCIEGTIGHQVYCPLKTQLDETNKNYSRVDYHIKGQNEWAEMYSIFKAEYPVEELVELGEEHEDNFDQRDIKKYYRGTQTEFKKTSKIDEPNSDEADGVYLQTRFNDSLYGSLTKDGYPIYICGEALSHCVNWSLRDLVAQLLKDNNTNYVENEKLKQGMVVLLIDCSSKVSPPGAEGLFNPQVKDLLEFCNKTNVTVRKSTSDNMLDINTLIKEYTLPPPSNGGSKRTRRARGGAYKPRTKKSNMRKRKTNKRKNKKRRNTKK